MGLFDDEEGKIYMVEDMMEIRACDKVAYDVDIDECVNKIVVMILKEHYSKTTLGDPSVAY
jgi:hypothetical protein